MRSNNVPVDNLYKIEFPEQPDRPPISCFRTAWVVSDGGLFWVDVTVVGPITEKPKDYLALSYRQAKLKGKAIADIVEFLEEGLG